MNLWVIRLSCLLVTLGGVLWYSVPSVTAESPLTLPLELSHEGLSFDTGLSFESPTQSHKVKIVFETVDHADSGEKIPDNVKPELFVTATQKKELKVEEIVLPTSKKETPTETPTPTKKISPTTKPQVFAATSAPTETPVMTATPTPAPLPEAQTASALPSYATNGSLNADTLFSMVNQKRSEAGLPAFEKHPEVCSVAEARRRQIENEVYGNSSIHAGFRAMNLPFRATENMISQGSEEAALNWWLNSSIHRAGILGSSKYACLVCQNKTCALIMSSLEPK